MRGVNFIRRKLWSLLAMVAGAALLFFELSRARGVNADNVFWLCVAGLILLLGTIDLFQKPRRPEDDLETPPDVH
jgi:hypothetical protein